jgi:hypothetical protein
MDYKLNNHLKNQYPQMVTKANNLLSNHWFDNYNTRRHNDKSSKESSNETEQDPKEKEELPEMSFANIEGKCYCCGKGGHKSTTCCLKAKIGGMGY